MSEMFGLWRNSASGLFQRQVFANITSLESRIAFQVARQIAPCNRLFVGARVNQSELFYSYIYFFRKCRVLSLLRRH